MNTGIARRDLLWFMHRGDARAGDPEPIRASRLVPSGLSTIAVDMIGPFVQARAPQPLFFHRVVPSLS